MKKILFITDTWKDLNANGIVTWLVNTQDQLERLGFTVAVVHPGQFRTVALPTYPELKMSLSTRSAVADIIRKNGPDYIHIATEGSLGLLARLACVKNNWKFTTFYHTRLPEYAAVRFKVLGRPTTRYVRWFHGASACTMVSTQTLKMELERKGFQNIAVSPMGVNAGLFHRNPDAQVPAGLVHPLFVFMGRLAPEKNIDAFLRLDLPGSSMVIGDGPSRRELEKKYAPRVFFTGYKTGTELVNLLSAADVLVFPSTTDTFSLVIIESLACGLPVAAYNVQGPNNIITDGYDGFLGSDLRENALKCLNIDRAHCVQSAERYSWGLATAQFVENLVAVA